MKYKSENSPTYKNIFRKFDKFESINNPYITPTPGEIPIIASTPVPKDTQIENSDFDLIRDWGANTAIAGPIPDGLDRVAQLLECAKNSGIKIILSGTGYPYNSYYEIVNEIHQNPLIGGYLIKDEPTFDEWKDYISKNINKKSLTIENLYELYQVMRKDFTQQMSFFNLAADPTQKKFMGNFETYEDFLEGFQEVFAPPVWMFDYYLARINLKNNPENTIIDYRYFYFYYFLLMFKSISKKTRRPFWSYCQCISEEIKDSWKLPIPTTDLVRFEAFTALAFGAKGIAYYRYAEWKENRPDYVFYTCPVIRDNVRPDVKIKTITWEVVKKVNEEINSYNRVFLYTELVNVFSSWFKDKHPDQKPGEDFSIDEVPLIELPYGPLVKVESDLNTNRRGVIISHLRLGIRNYIIFISRSAQDSQTITTLFSYNRELRFVGMGGVTKVEKSISSNSVLIGEYKWDINPGGYFIVEWDESNEINPYIVPIIREFPIIIPYSFFDIDALAMFESASINDYNANIIMSTCQNYKKVIETLTTLNCKTIIGQEYSNDSEFFEFVRQNMMTTNIGGWCLRYYYYCDVEKKNSKKTHTNPNHSSTNFEKFNELYDEITKWDPIHSVYFTIPFSIIDNAITNANLAESLDNIQNEFHPALWTFEFFPIRGTENNMTCDYINFYGILNVFSKNSTKTQKPFWFKCLTSSWKYENQYIFPLPSEITLRFQIFTALAFGAKGIEYISTPSESNNPIWEHISTPKPPKVRQLTIYDTLSQINSEIKKYNKVFINTRLVGIFSSTDLLNSIDKLVLPYGPLISLKSENMGIHLSHLKDNNKNYFIMIGRRINTSVKVSVRFDMLSHVEFVGGACFIQNVEIPTKNQFGNETEWTLNPGGYIIFSYEDYN